MIAVLLGILKVIGILILILLGVALIIIAAILFVPIRYRISGAFSKEDYHMGGSVTWGGLIFRAKGSLKEEEGVFYQVRILGLTIAVSDERKTLLRRIQKLREKKNKEQEEHRPGEYPYQGDGECPVPYGQQRPEEFENDDDWEEDFWSREANRTWNGSSYEGYDGTYEHADHTSGWNDEWEPVEPEKEPWTQKLQGFVKEKRDERKEKKEREKESFFDKFDNIEEKIENLVDKYEVLEKFYYHNKTQYAVQKMAGLIKKTIAYVLPTRAKGHLRYGLWDPAATGKSYAVLCITGAALHKGFDICPDFDEMMLEGEIDAKGRIRAIYFVRLAMTIFFDKKLKAVYRQGKRVIGGLKNE